MEDDATRVFFAWLLNEESVGIFALVGFLILVTAIVAGSIYFLRNTRARRHSHRAQRTTDAHGHVETGRAVHWRASFCTIPLCVRENQTFSLIPCYGFPFPPHTFTHIRFSNPLKQQTRNGHKYIDAWNS
ncbi:uncharacterized protein LOC143187495 [Calliopsis andreniformis]|uniref:uncharacterized protein LOC143187495 n=1 Tax=Calliopsis andreniformis TaxID=337506 RepID=UPI003FCC6460